MRFKGVIFDLDGTVLDTIKDLTDSVNAALAEYGFSGHTEDEYKQMVGNGFANLIMRAIRLSVQKAGATDAEKENRLYDFIPDDVLPSGRMSEAEEMELRGRVYEAFLEDYSRRYMLSTAPYPGIQAMLNRLMEAGIPIGINSNKRDDYTKALIAKNFPDITFADVIGGRSDMPSKPDPAAAHAIAQKMGIPGKKGLFRRAAGYSEIAYAGDSNVDMETAKNAGMTPVGCAWGFRGSGELAENGAVYIAGDAQDLTDYLLGE